MIHDGGTLEAPLHRETDMSVFQGDRTSAAYKSEETVFHPSATASVGAELELMLIDPGRAALTRNSRNSSSSNLTATGADCVGDDTGVGDDTTGSTAGSHANQTESTQRALGQPAATPSCVGPSVGGWNQPLRSGRPAGELFAPAARAARPPHAAGIERINDAFD